MTAAARRPRMVCILAFDDMEVLDFAGPYEVFNVAGELSDPAEFSVVSVALDDAPVAGRGGFAVLPRYTLSTCPRPDLLIIPGGSGTRRLLQNETLLEWVRAVAADADLVASVCTGALILAAAGLLEGKDATTHHGAFDELTALSPTTTLRRTERFVQSGERLWTSGGISAGIDLSLELVRICADDATQRAVVEEMEWGWGGAS